MRKKYFFKQLIEVFIKIIFSFLIIFGLYFVSWLTNDFSYNYFIFPLLSIIVIFVCGISIGRYLERMKHVDYNSVQSKTNNQEIELNGDTEFIISDTSRDSTSKKVLKEVVDGDKVHIKVFNYNDIVDERESE